MTTSTAVRAGAGVLVALAAAACMKAPVPLAVPEPVASTSAGAVEFYTRVQRDVLAALSAEFPELRFGQRYARTDASCRLDDGTTGTVVHLPIHGSDSPVPPDRLERAAELFEQTAARAGFHGRQLLPPDTGFAIRLFAADGSYVTFGSYVAATVGLSVGCYRD
ncbi:LppA family lipoprotein [Rhodococcus chondri]|uniref:LppA family lipoprotein n=1 Tax=Rhodococcus chondri TaxID=3065941 RepID=A0ABU7JXC5_9NOCA|nr:LppA family lipoprotein [Rhodococcus sp. CC-R104]MEE2034665.1 LppA family lipoprotein [Rhodococcus sp. CC-R104]